MSLYRFNGFEFDSSSGVLRDGEAERHVRHKVAQLLGYLIEHRDRVVSKTELLESLWEQGEMRENSLTQGVREARRLLGDSAQQPSFIRNYPQRGYQWIAPTEQISPAAPVQVEARVEPEIISQIAPEPLPPSRRRPAVLLMAALVLICTVAIGWQLSAPEERVQQAEHQPRLMVLPFINETGDNSLQWMELGLSDMLATALGQSSELTIIAPAASHNRLALEGLAWPPEPDQLKALMAQQNIDLLLLSRVSLYRQQQVLNVELYRADGRTVQGSISYPELAVATSAVAAQLQQLINPARVVSSVPELAAHPASVQDLVRGLQALQQQGPLLAANYFTAARLQDPANAWAQTYSGLSALQLGDWKGAQARFASLATTTDPVLAGFVCRWQGEIAYRQGNLSEAQQTLIACASQAEGVHDQRIQYESYRLLAQISHQQYDWPQFRHWSQLATDITATDTELAVQAERLFYLGNPVESGLEKDPYNDLLQNGPRLKQALNYYQALGNQPRIAASRFALAQNYTLPLAEREAALNEAIMLWRSLAMPFELAQALTYQGFYQLQLHQGGKAVAPLDEAVSLTRQLGAQRLGQQAQLYRAFADMDQGLVLTGQPQRDLLNKAVMQFDQLLAAGLLPEKEQADAQVFSGWALAALGQFEQANARQQLAQQFFSQQSMAVSFGYSVYSQMWNALQRNQLETVIQLGEQPIETRLQLRYLAEAYHRTQQYKLAAQAFAQIRLRFTDSWRAEDNQILTAYRLQPERGLGPLASAHQVYCETDWTLAETSGVLGG